MASSASPFPMWRLWLSEAVGTALLVGVGVAAEALAHLHVIPDAAARSAAPGLVLLALVYMLSDVSGAHLNPAVSLAFAVRGSLPWRRLPGYWAAQIVGALLAGRVVSALLPAPPFRAQVSLTGAFWLETACAAFLVLVILATAQRKASVGPETGVAVGGTVALVGLTAGFLASISLNSAAALGTAAANTRWDLAWPHVFGPLAGGVLAAGLTSALRGRVDGEEASAAQGEEGQQAT